MCAVPMRARSPTAFSFRAVPLLFALLAGCRGGEQKQQGQANANQPLPVEVTKLEPGPVRETGEYIGTLISNSSVAVFPQAAGYIERIYVQRGQHVKEGQPLMEVDPRQQRAGLQAAEAQKASARANLQLARSNLQRADRLFREGVITRQDHDQAVAQAQAAEAAVQASGAQAQEQRVALGFHRVVAPFDGVVGEIPVKVGDLVSTQTQLTHVDQSQALEVAVQIPVERAAQVKPGHTPVEVLDEQGKPVVSAPIYFVSPTPDARTQLVAVRAAFPNTANLRSGQQVRTRVVYETRESLRLPTYAVTRQGGQEFALVVGAGDAGTVVHLQPVKLGEVEGNFFEVREGLQPGAEVAVGSLQLLHDGSPIQPRPAPPKGEEGPGVGGGGGRPDGGTGGADGGTGGGADGGR